MIYQKTYDQLLHACKQMTYHKQKLAKPVIENLVLPQVSPATSNEALLAHLISESILKRLDRNLLESKNIFIEEFDIPQIVMFYKMSQAYPHVQLSHEIANQYIFDTVKDLQEFTFFDIGIGQGIQIRNLLLKLIGSSSNLQRVNVIGLDPNRDILFTLQENLRQFREALPFELNFFPICNLIERWTEKDYAYVQAVAGNNLVINSAYTLHHTIHPLDDSQHRTDILSQLHALNPLIFTMIEPNSNHDTENLQKRFHNCWEHFGNVFELIDNSSLTPIEKFTIKEKFFGREVRDIFGVSDIFRCERHEQYDSWLLRLTRSGFKPKGAINLTMNVPPSCNYDCSDGLVRLRYKDMTLIAIFAYQI